MEKHRDYFEGILQIRDPTKDIINFIENKIKAKPNVFISKIVKAKNGFDYYISDKKYIQNLGRRLQKEFGGELKISPKLFSRDHLTSKDIYRVNVLFRLSKFKKGDIIKVKGEEIKVISAGKKIFGKSLETGKKVSIGYNKL